MRPITINLPDHTRGDTWEGIVMGPVTINGAPPPAAAVSCRLQFRDRQTGALGLEMNNDPGDGEVEIVIDDAALWLFSVAPQILPLAAGRYKWDLQVTDAAGVVRTIYAGSFRHVEDVTRD